MSSSWRSLDQVTETHFVSSHPRTNNFCSFKDEVSSCHLLEFGPWVNISKMDWNGSFVSLTKIRNKKDAHSHLFDIVLEASLFSPFLNMATLSKSFSTFYFKI